MIIIIDVIILEGPTFAEERGGGGDGGSNDTVSERASQWRGGAMLRFGKGTDFFLGRWALYHIGRKLLCTHTCDADVLI